MSLGVYYVIRHKEKDEFMPQLRRGKGYTHWNPGKVDTKEHLAAKLSGCPRIFPSRRTAVATIAAWANYPNLEYRDHYDRESGYSEYSDKITPDDRKKEDLEVLEVIIDLHHS